MLKRFLFIGVGGSGGKTLRVLREELAHRLESLDGGWTKTFPDAWQFLQIDVPTEPDGLSPDLPPPLPPESYVGLVEDGVSYRDLDRTLMGQAEANSGVLRSLVGWRPDPTGVNVNIWRGAGQYRTLGRVVASTRLHPIAVAMDRAIAALDDRCVGELREIADALNLDSEGSPADPVVIIVTSLAGGSGSGIFLDVCDALRSREPTWADTAVGMLFAPDVFNDLPAPLKAGVQPNTLAALSELLASYWNTDDDRSADAYALLEMQGLAPQTFEKHGLVRPFVVGAKNGKVSFKSQNEMYRAAGKTLAAWVLSESLQDTLNAYIEGQWVSSASAAAVPNSLGLNEPTEPMAVNAMGFASLTLGRDRFAEYASERLAKLALERILRGHHDPTGSVKPKVALANATRDAAVEEFLRRCRLSEVGAEHNDVLDALRPGGANATLVSSLQQMSQEVRQSIASGPAVARPPIDWVGIVREAVTERRSALEGQNVAERHELAKQWVNDIQDRIREVTESVVATQGGLVAVGLLEQLDPAIEAIIQDLENERQAKIGASMRLSDAAAGEIEAFGQAMLPDNPKIARAVESLAKSISNKAEAELREVAIELLGELRDSFVGPLTDALRRGVKALETSEIEKTRDGDPPICSTWPTGEYLPAKFEAAQNEVYINPPSGFEEAFKAQITKTVDVKQPVAAINRATEAAILHIPDPDADVPERLLSIDEYWVPTRVEYRAEGFRSTPATVSVQLGLDLLVKRARAWVLRVDESNAIGAYVQEHLRDYLGSGDEQAARIRDFQSKFEEALSCSEPLVEVNAGVFANVHPGVDRHRILSIFSEMPFAQNSPAGQAVTQVMNRRKLPLTALDFSDLNSARIDVFTCQSSPYHPIVYKSLLEPIASEWGASRADPDRRKAFWQWRRARQLPQFVPLSPKVRRNIIRGWYVARVLEQLRIEKTGETAVFLPDKNRWADFPSPLLSPGLKAIDRLAAVLEALPIAFIDYYLGSYSALVPYQRLRELGRQEVVTGELGQWIEDGLLADGAPSPVEPGVTCSSQGERHKVILSSLERRRAALDKVLTASLSTEPEKFFAISPTWELRDELRSELDRLMQEVTAYEDDDGDD